MMTNSTQLLQALDKRTLEFGAQYHTFGIFGVINYPLCYFILHYVGTQTNEDLTVRLFATLLCIPLIFIDQWPLKAKKYLNLYWLTTVMYCLPFLGTYMLLKNHVSTEWLMNEALGLFLLILLVDWLVFSIVLSAGIVLGYLSYIVLNQEVIIATQSLSSLYLVLYTYIYTILIGLVFARNKEKMVQEKLASMKMLAGAIAHELRTPLASISMMSTNLKKSLTRLFESQENQGSTEPDKALMSMPERLNSTAKNAFTIIDMVLMNLKDVSGQDVSKIISMEYYVRETLADYPLTETEKSLINFNPTTDFEFKGDETLFKHVLFNLLKNALHYVKASGKGEITITLKPGRYENQLIFKDTGKGMPESMVPHIFDRFYSRTQHGTGIGLAFCKSVMSKFKGSIACESIENVHTTFILSFPVVTEFEKAVAA